MESSIASGEGRIRPRARLLRTIGAELISSEVVAVIELVRNCYDADAGCVEIVFTTPHKPGQATLEIRDDGHGMTREVLLGPWLEPATAHKAGAGSRSPRGRRRLGSKGVGRFAAQRLGEHLTVHTRSDGTPAELRAEFDWSVLDSADRYLDEVSVPWEEGAPERLHDPGTSLFVSRLKDAWTEDRFEKLKLGLSRLTSPTRDDRDQFTIRIIVDDHVEEVRPALEKTAAMYSIEGEVEDGRARIVYRDLSGAEEDWLRTVYWPADAATCGPFSFRVQAWDLDREPLKYFLARSGSPFGLREFRRLIRDHSGISLYRDGFRILPYGEPDNDWLRLDRRRVNNPTMRFSNNQLFGWLQLGADTNPELRDQTNREGLVTNDAYVHLQRVVLELLAYFEARRFTARRSLEITWSRRTKALPAAGGPDPEMDLALAQLEQGSSASALDELKRVLEDRRRAMTETLAHYAALATVGQMSGLVFGQLEHPIGAIEAETRQLEADLELDLAEDVAEDALESLARIRRKCARMRRQMETLDPLAMARRARRVERVELRLLTEQVLAAYRGVLNERGIQIEIDGGEVWIDTVPVLVQQALANLVQNAIDALSTRSDGRLLRVLVGKRGLMVSNNGPAVPEDVRDHIFQPHFTTRDGAAGMGLTLAAELIGSIGGRVVLTPNHKRVTFEIRLN